LHDKVTVIISLCVCDSCRQDGRNVEISGKQVIYTVTSEDIHRLQRTLIWVRSRLQLCAALRRAVKKFLEMWYGTEMVGHMTTLT